MKRHNDTIKLDDLAHRLTREAKLVRQLADQHNEAQHHIAAEMSVLGWPQRSGNEIRGTSELTTVERDAAAAHRLTAIGEDVRDQVTASLMGYRGFCAHLTALGIILATARKTGLSKAESAALRKTTLDICCDNQVGRHAVAEWGDPLCSLSGTKAGLCGQHYMTWYRARIRDGIDTSRDHQPATP
jgi:hypothetical protein|tara:strand:+ start:1057 stop:1614 length:558 start_codon:yes stop_codon:yes gene_type:complete